MNDDEDNTLRSAVQKCLENNGVLGNIKAQLRAAVILALQEEGYLQKIPLFNEKFAEFASKKNGRITISLIREFLQFFDMEFTLLVLDSKLQALKMYLLTAEELCEELKLNHVKLEAPVLVKLLKNYIFQDSICRTPSPTFKPDDNLKTGFEFKTSLSPERCLTSESRRSSQSSNNDFEAKMTLLDPCFEDLSHGNMQPGARNSMCEGPRGVLKTREAKQSADSQFQNKEQKSTVAGKVATVKGQVTPEAKTVRGETLHTSLPRLLSLRGRASVLKRSDRAKGKIERGSTGVLDSRYKILKSIKANNSSDDESISSLDSHFEFDYEQSNDDSEVEFDPNKVTRALSLNLRKISKEKTDLSYNFDRYKSNSTPVHDKDVEKGRNCVSAMERSKNQSPEKSLQG